MRKQKAFTLIEVLVALVIMTIALAAAIKVIGDDSKNLAGLQSRTSAHWIAMNVIDRIQTDLLPVQKGEHYDHNETTMLNNKWLWSLKTSETDNKSVLRLDIDVNKPDKETSESHITGFYLQKPA